MTETNRPTGSLRWLTLVIVCVSTFMLMLDLSVVAIALPGIHTSLNADLGQMQWVFDAYALTLAAFLVTAGSVADRSGRKRIFLVGLAVFTLASLACGLAGTIDVLNVSRGVQGVGAAIMFAVGPALIGHEFHGKERGVAFSAFGGAIGIAVATGPLIGGGLTNGPGWRWIFFLNVPVGAVLVLVAAWKLRESRLAKASKPDFIGTVAFTVSLAALVLAIIRSDAHGWFSTSNIALYVVSAAGLALFIGVARRRGANAMFDLSLFRGRTFLGLSAVTFLANIAGLPPIFLLTSYMQNVLHSTAWQAGLRFLPLTGAMFVFGALNGALTGKLPFRAILSGALIVLCAGLMLTHRSGADDSWTALIPSLVAIGAAFGMFNPSRAAMAIGVVEPARAGVASGINEAFQQVGTALGIAIGGSFFAHRVNQWFLDSASGHQLGANGHALSAAISSGSIDAAARSTGPLYAQVLADGRAAFTSGFHDTMTFCAAFAVAGAIVAIAFLRDRDLHPSARTGIPPEVTEEPVPTDEVASTA